MALVLATASGDFGTVRARFAILFPANKVGYFLGSFVKEVIGGSVGMIVWGIAYGLFLGDDLGTAQQLTNLRSSEIHKKESPGGAP